MLSLSISKAGRHFRSVPCAGTPPKVEVVPLKVETRDESGKLWDVTWALRL